MATVSIRDLRNRGGDVVERARMGEQLTITSSGRPVATLGPLPRRPLGLEAILRRRATLPPIDPRSLRDDLDRVVDPEL
ncbi:MAG TPA: type II toxin-antitoxin system prevent-host-death family antitoxin [Acidimicrobiales bacterium]|nr:type II toxin-antitoxin system prevent-host-death family antitoxin [Acidimicrobiales bacterium]